MNLVELKDKIESLSNQHQIDILRILHKHNDIVLNENKNGIFVNLTDIKEEVIKDLVKYVEYVEQQQFELNEIESKKQNIEKDFFTDT